MQHPHGLPLSPYALAPPPHYSDYRGEYTYVLSPTPSYMSSAHAGPSSACSSPAAGSSAGPKHRINLACAYCRRRKIKCTGEAPCPNCVRTGRQCVYEQVSEEQNKATKERKATLKSLKIQTLQAQGADTSRGVQSTPPRGRAHVRTTSMPYLPSRLAPAAPIQGWVPQYDSFASSSAPASAGLSSRPFPSVLAGTPVHAAYIANTGRASPAEQQTYSHAVEQAHAHGPLAATPPRSRSPSPAHQFPPSLNATYSRSGGVPAGYTSYFPQTPYSPTEEASVSGSSFTSSTHSPTTPFTPFEPAFHYQQQARDPKFALASHEMASSFSASSSSSLGIHIAPGHQQHQQAHYHSPSLGSAAHAYAPPSPTRKPRHPALHRATQSLGGNPGLGFDLPLGFAPDMPVDPAFERAVSGLSACQIAYDAGHAEEEVTYSWGTA